MPKDVSPDHAQALPACRSSPAPQAPCVSCIASRPDREHELAPQVTDSLQRRPQARCHRHRPPLSALCTADLPVPVVLPDREVARSVVDAVLRERQHFAYALSPAATAG